MEGTAARRWRFDTAVGWRAEADERITMWAPADLFTPLVSIFLSPLKQLVSYLYEHPIVLALVLIAVAMLIGAITLVGERRAGRG